jgi:hypothetical protein
VCNGMITVEVRRVSNNQLVGSGEIDPCGAWYQGTQSSQTPYCNSPNSFLILNLQEGVQYKWTASCSADVGMNERVGYFGTSAFAITPDGCVSILIGV